MTNGKEETNAATEQHLHAMMTAFALSRQEARLTLGLVSGLSLKVSAQTIGVRYETARGYLKSIFAKTDCNSQTALLLKTHRDLDIRL
ncbi:MAG: hypothetical protein Q9M17_01975 [Mariprofundus sp.]|nr:hypothetical protein [Mariprofundus sp.]